LAGLFAAVRDADLRSTVALINRPALVIAGQHDTVTAASHGELIAAAVQARSCFSCLRLPVERGVSGRVHRGRTRFLALAESLVS